MIGWVEEIHAVISILKTLAMLWFDHSLSSSNTRIGARKCRICSYSLTVMKIGMKNHYDHQIEVMPAIPYIGVVFPLVGSLSLECHNFEFFMSLKEMLTFLLLPNPVLQYLTLISSSRRHFYTRSQTLSFIYGTVSRLPPENHHLVRSRTESPTTNMH